MKYRYVGDGNESPQRITFFGQEFLLDGEAQEIQDDYAKSIIDGVRTFVRVDEKPEMKDLEAEAKKQQEELEAVRAELTEKGIRFHHATGIKKLKALLEESE